MITIDKQLKKEYFLNGDGQFCVGYKDEKNEIKAVFPLVIGSELIDILDELADYNLPEMMPNNIYELETILRELYENMVKAHICKETILYLGKSKNTNEEDYHKLMKYVDKVMEKCNSEIKIWADLHPLWMGHEHNNLKYEGENPNNMYPSLAYATPDMFDSIVTERNIIRSIAFGAYNFDIIEISNATVGKKYIQSANEFLKEDYVNKRK